MLSLIVETDLLNYHRWKKKLIKNMIKYVPDEADYFAANEPALVLDYDWK